MRPVPTIRDNSSPAIFASRRELIGGNSGIWGINLSGGVGGGSGEDGRASPSPSLHSVESSTENLSNASRKPEDQV